MEATRVLELLRGLQLDHKNGEGSGVRLARACVELVAVTGAGIVLMDHDGNASPLGLSDDATGVVEDQQFTLGEGPGIDAHERGRPVLEPRLDKTVDDRWPVFAPAAVDAGFLGVFAFPLRIGAIRFGALDLYQDVGGDLGRDQLADAKSMADIVTRAVIAAQADADPGLLADDLEGAGVQTRVHQAAGMISGQLDVHIVDALVRLRAHAYAVGQPVDEVARNVVERRLRFE